MLLGRQLHHLTEAHEADRQLGAGLLLPRPGVGLAAEVAVQQDLEIILDAEQHRVPLATGEY